MIHAYMKSLMCGDFDLCTQSQGYGDTSRKAMRKQTRPSMCR